MRQKRSLGQIFLEDKKYVSMILDQLDVAGKIVLEIGPGKGIISEYISDKAKHLCCVEIDQRFSSFLREKFKDKGNVEIIRGDILKFPLPRLGKEIVVFGNVPYMISSQLISYFVNYRSSIKKAYLTFQKEFVQKLTASSSGDGYGFISCYLQYYGKLRKVFDIPACAFSPVPKVDSSFLEVEFYSEPKYKAKDEDFLFKVIGKAFSARRKKIINVLGVPCDKREFFSSLNINPNLRAENISLKEYIDIANKLQK